MLQGHLYSVVHPARIHLLDWSIHWSLCCWHSSSILFLTGLRVQMIKGTSRMFVRNQRFSWYFSALWNAKHLVIWVWVKTLQNPAWPLKTNRFPDVWNVNRNHGLNDVWFPTVRTWRALRARTHQRNICTHRRWPPWSPSPRAVKQSAFALIQELLALESLNHLSKFSHQRIGSSWIFFDSIGWKEQAASLRKTHWKTRWIIATFIHAARSLTP